MSDGDQAVSFIYLVGVLVLVTSALMVRRIPLAQGLKMALGWVLIFAAAFAVVALWDDFAALGRRLIGEASGDSRPVMVGETVRVRMAGDGHFWIDGAVNGEDVRFLVDSGATRTAITGGTARRAGVERSSDFPAVLNTANGRISVERGRVALLEAGPIVREDVPVYVSDAFGDTNVLGMNFLSSLQRWEVEGQWLILTP